MPLKINMKVGKERSIRIEGLPNFTMSIGELEVHGNCLQSSNTRFHNHLEGAHEGPTVVMVPSSSSMKVVSLLSYLLEPVG